ncbi:S-layer homology domain-containing protein [Brevibacillus reuszeri]|uniref:S-layer homology domain-containing protein n=1 Tax=Brevibacillus reuszeri TaxID=54915 RepID=UPI001FD3F72C|nr:S-layer homology domain-containing protein [Brevibacillus reuszeri]
MMNKQRIHIWFVSLVFLMYSLTLAIGVPASTASTNSLRDIGNSYAQKQIRSLHEAGVIAGDENGYFHPTSPVTRAEFVTMLSRTVGIKPVSGTIVSYTDVPKSSWAYGYVQAAAALNIANGIGPTTFAPKRTISREEAAAFLVRALEQNASTTTNLNVKDAKMVSSWARNSVSKAMQNNWLVGYQGYFRPSAPLSRQETAVILQRILDDLNAQTAASRPLVSLGWQYQSTTEEFIAQVKKSSVNTLSPRWYFLQKDGTVSDFSDVSLVNWAHDNGKQVWALFGNKFDSAATHAALSDAGKRKAIVQKLSGFIDKYQLDGINVDFEGFAPGDRNNFTLFIQELATALHAKGAVLSVDIPPDSGTDWSEPYDFTELAKYADYLVLMAYEEHWVGGTKSGSVASLPWIKKIISDLLDEMPAKKLIVGLPLYTRDWYQSGKQLQSVDLSIPESYQLISQYKASSTWDDSIGQYRSTYKKQGVTHSIWLEESRSMGLKVQASLQWDIGGLAYWYVGSESTDMWTAIANSITLKQARARL